MKDKVNLIDITKNNKVNDTFSNSLDMFSIISSSYLNLFWFTKMIISIISKKYSQVKILTYDFYIGKPNRKKKSE